VPASKIPRRGQWNRYFEVKRGTQLVSASGAAKLNWSAPVKVISGYASRSGTYGIERDTAGKDVAEMQYSYETGYQPGVTSAMRVYDGSQVFDIISVEIDQAAWVMRLLCRENLNG